MRLFIPCVLVAIIAERGESKEEPHSSFLDVMEIALFQANIEISLE